MCRDDGDLNATQIRKGVGKPFLCHLQAESVARNERLIDGLEGRRAAGLVSDEINGAFDRNAGGEDDRAGDTAKVEVLKREGHVR